MESYSHFFMEAGVPEAIFSEFIHQMFERFKRFDPGIFEVKSISDNDIFSFDHFEMRTICCQGHTPGSVCFFDQQGERLYSGDHLLQNTITNPIIEIGNPEIAEGYKSLARYSESLETLRNMDIKLVLPGHGTPFSSHRKRIREIQRHHRVRRQALLDALKAQAKSRRKKNGMTLFMLKQEIFPDLRDAELFLGLSEIFGHMEVLEEEGLITSDKRKGQRFYCLSPKAGRTDTR
jgi:glyoxylase-like metal-dependent hydrolase (beta-lactamase superfamily II)